jgi:hypothetical protein
MCPNWALRNYRFCKAFRIFMVTPTRVSASASEMPESEDCITYSDATLAFASVSRNLKQIGSISLENFLSDNMADKPNPSRAIATPQTRDRPTPPSEPHPVLSLTDSRPGRTQKPVNNKQQVLRLQTACRLAFGNIDALNYEFLEENGPHSTILFESVPIVLLKKSRQTVYSHYYSLEWFKPFLYHKSGVHSQG